MNRSRITGDLVSQNNIFVNTTNDRVGIGSTIPTNKLDVRGIIESRNATNFHESLWSGENTKIQLQAGYLHIQGGSNGTIFRRLNGGNCFHITSAGHLITALDSTFDIGTNSSRIRNIYADNLYGDGSNLTGIANGNIASNAAIAGSKIDPDFTGQIVDCQQLKITHHTPTLKLIDNNNDSDFDVMNQNGVFKVYDRTNSVGRLHIASDGTTDIFQNLNVGAGLDVTGAITATTTGTFTQAVTCGGLISNSNVTVENDTPSVTLNDINSENDFRITNLNGTFILHDNDAGATRMSCTSAGQFTFATNVDFSAGIDIIGDITGTGDLTLTDTTADSAAGPEFKLFRNSASPANADYLGQIKFAGESSTGVERNYAKITGKILDVTNGAEDGILEFAHIKNGSQVITGRWRSDSLQLLNDTNLSVDGIGVFGRNTLDPDSYGAASGGFGGISDGSGWGAMGLFVHGGGTGDVAAIGHNGNRLYFGIQDGAANNSMETWLDVVPGSRIINFQTDDNANNVRIGGNKIFHAGNDGAGSGLDADTLDGQHGSYYRDASNLNAGTIDDARLPGTITSNITGTANNSEALKIVDTRNDGARVPNDYAAHKVTAEFTNQVINGWWSAVTVKGWANGYAPWQLWGKSDTTQNINLYARFGHGSNNTWSSLYTVWHSGVDGSGSGLDADTLDGIDSPAFIRTSGSSIVVAADGNNYPRITHNQGSAQLGLFRGTNSVGGMYIGADVNSFRIWTDNFTARLTLTQAGSVSTTVQGTVWGSSNDGSGSGLDADTCDGQHLGSSANVNFNTVTLAGNNAIARAQTLRYRDLRNVAPADESANSLRFYFTSWGNSGNSSGYADGLHLRSYGDSSGGSDNLVVWYKNGFGMRQFQQSFGSSTDYTSYAQYFHGQSHAIPQQDNTFDLGSTTYRWRNILSEQLNVTKASGNLSGTFMASNGLGTLEIGGSTGAFIDLKMPTSDDFDFRLGTGGSGGYMNVPSGQAISVTGHFNPAGNNAYDLGTTSLRWRNLYTNDLNLSNEGSTNDVDGTWGSYTIQEGENDLFLINKRSGKKYKFNLTEVS